MMMSDNIGSLARFKSGFVGQIAGGWYLPNSLIDTLFTRDHRD
jgi:hypothetical protein